MNKKVPLLFAALVSALVLAAPFAVAAVGTEPNPNLIPGCAIQKDPGTDPYCIDRGCSSGGGHCATMGTTSCTCKPEE